VNAGKRPVDGSPVLRKPSADQNGEMLIGGQRLAPFGQTQTEETNPFFFAQSCSSVRNCRGNADRGRLFSFPSAFLIFKISVREEKIDGGRKAL
jgi:hypothetical protein